MTTIQDIADQMGISKSTVSKALNDAPDISEALRKQVLETAVALGYTKLRRYKKSTKKVCIIIEKENIAIDISISHIETAAIANAIVTKGGKNE